MIGGIVGDVVGSVYEGSQWASRNLPLIQTLPLSEKEVTPILKNRSWVRKEYGWTDDTLCTLGLYNAYINQSNPTTTLQETCVQYMQEGIGFGKAFTQWLKNPVPYQSYANGCIMRIGFIPFLNLTIDEQLQLGKQYTEISHNHIDSFNAVDDYLQLSHQLMNCHKDYSQIRAVLNTYLHKREWNASVEDMHNKKSFEMNALTTLTQAIAILHESNSFESVLRNCLYVGGDTDTLACIACNIASIYYGIPNELHAMATSSLSENKVLYDLAVHFMTNYQPSTIT